MKKDKNNKTFSERFDEEFDDNFFDLHYRFCEIGNSKKNSICSKYKETLKKEIKQFFISELKDIEKEFEKEAAEEMLICQKENQPTSRLTSLSNKLSEIIKKRI